MNIAIDLTAYPALAEAVDLYPAGEPHHDAVLADLARLVATAKREERERAAAECERRAADRKQASDNYSSFENWGEASRCELDRQEACKCAAAIRALRDEELSNAGG